MKKKHLVIVTFPLLAMGATLALAQQNFDLPGRTKQDVPDVPVPPVPKPECVSCPDGYHCNDAKDGCEADDPPPAPPPPPPPPPPPSPPHPSPPPPQPDEGETDVPPP